MVCRQTTAIWLWSYTTQNSRRTKPQFASSNLYRERIIMFETAVQEKRTGVLWGVIVAFVAFAALLGTGYFLIH